MPPAAGGMIPPAPCTGRSFLWGSWRWLDSRSAADRDRRRRRLKGNSVALARHREKC
ncbi:hypothetical protein NY78_0919 [Desulfovibrio sp. TomC]|nr:hypothetical protein NY78_0919 [Desulfovibrio sp. TomC]